MPLIDLKQIFSLEIDACLNIPDVGKLCGTRTSYQQKEDAAAGEKTASSNYKKTQSINLVTPAIIIKEARDKLRGHKQGLK